MAKINSFRELLVWQKSMDLAERSYRLTRRFKREDQLVLGHEIRKSSVSMPSNIAEGFGRHHTADGSGRPEAFRLIPQTALPPAP
jgi:hypothetical protein